MFTIHDIAAYLWHGVGVPFALTVLPWVLLLAAILIPPPPEHKTWGSAVRTGIGLLAAFLAGILIVFGILKRKETI